MPCLQTEKAQSRRYFLTMRKALSAQEISIMSEQICAAVYGEIKKAGAKRVLLYSPVKGEPDVLPLMNILLCEGIEVAFPVCDTESCLLSFRSVSGQFDLILGAYGIPEPRCECAELTDFSDTLCIVPALSADKHGFRLGYGKGYYDRFLPRLYSAGGASLCPLYHEFLCNELSHEDTDIPVNIICTQKEVIYPHHENKIKLWSTQASSRA